MLRRLHLGDDLHLFEIPQENRVVQTASDHFRRIWHLLLVCSEHFGGLEHDYLQDGLGVTLHLSRLDALLDPVRLDAVVGVDEQASPLIEDIGLPFISEDLNSVDFLLAELLGDNLVLVVDVDDVDVAFVVCGIQLVLLVVPADAGVKGLVWIGDAVLLFALCCFEPFEVLIIANREDEVLLNDQENLNDADSVDFLLC